MLHATSVVLSPSDRGRGNDSCATKSAQRSFHWRPILRLMFVGTISVWLSAAYTAEVKAPSTAAGGAGEKPAIPNYLAKVGPETIGLDEYLEKVQAGIREKFFHGKVPDKELKQFRRELAQELVNRVLHVQEAKRLGLAPDKAEVEKRIKNEERKKKNDTYWQEHRDQFIRALRKEFEMDSLVLQLENSIRSGVQPAASAVQQFYKSNENKFTAPERVKVHIILFKVDPSSPSEEWEKTAKFAAEIVKQIRSGKSFEEFARIHSGDDSAAAGGDMGYIHKGMMGENGAVVLEKMKPGELSEPVYLLEGIAIFRLDDRELPRVNELPRVENSAKELLRKDLADKAWKDFTEQLRTRTVIHLNEAVL